MLVGPLSGQGHQGWISSCFAASQSESAAFGLKRWGTDLSRAGSFDFVRAHLIFGEKGSNTKLGSGSAEVEVKALITEFRGFLSIYNFELKASFRIQATQFNLKFLKAREPAADQNALKRRS